LTAHERTPDVRYARQEAGLDEPIGGIPADAELSPDVVRCHEVIALGTWERARASLVGHPGIPPVVLPLASGATGDRRSLLVVVEAPYDCAGAMSTNRECLNFTWRTPTY
jgi:hypothetical protein